MKDLKLTGGAKIGRLSSSYPFATLKVNPECLELNAFIISKLVFQASDIEPIEPYKIYSISTKGIKINHTVANYKASVIFWTRKSPHSVIQQIEEIGFFNDNNSSEKIIDNNITIK